METSKKIKEQLKPLDLNLTPRAASQINLILENDYTLENKLFRVQISGKGCSGFNYATGFDEIHEDDIIAKIFVKEMNQEMKLLLDPFTAFYFHQGTIDYQIDPETNEDGFVIMNVHEETYFGKFFKDESLVPKM